MYMSACGIFYFAYIGNLLSQGKDESKVVVDNCNLQKFIFPQTGTKHSNTVGSNWKSKISMDFILGNWSIHA